ncbi:dihydrofolate reductase family protein [Paenibacillus sp. NPDC056722]|uniref:dihydrofolate reductase family protein n=1 Tax=Paenibacillus sp. NPDC056722 TaxID=3345924 RepID=UPI0036830BEB
MKPMIICHMESTVDGRLDVTRYSKPFDGKSSDEVLDIYFQIAEQVGGEATILGRVTLQEFLSLKTFEHSDEPPTKDRNPFVGKRNGKRTFIVTDPGGKVMYDEQSDYCFIALLSEQVSDRYLEHLRDWNVSYLFSGADGKDMTKAMEILGNDFGFKKLRLEGGGIINGNFLKAGLLDELSLLIYPGIDGLSGMPSIFEYNGKGEELPAAGQALELTSVKQLNDGMVWLYYKFHKIDN